MNKTVILAVILAIPVAASAQTVQALVAVAGEIAWLLVSIGAVLAFVAFFYGLAVFIFNAGDEKKVEEGKSWMIWSIIAVFVLVTIWGIIGLLQRTVGNTEGLEKVDIIIPRF